MNTNPTRSRADIIATLTVISLVGAAGAWVFGRKVPPKSETFRAIAVDASITSDHNSRCDDVVGLADEAAQLSKGVLHLTLFATGDRTSGFEAVRIGTVEFEPGTRLVEGRAADDERCQQFLCETQPGPRCLHPARSESTARRPPRGKLACGRAWWC
jgi:hypothetical protein